MTGIVLVGVRLQDVRVDGSPAQLANLRMAQASYLLIEDSSLRQPEFYQAWIGDRALLDLQGSVLDELRGALLLRGANIRPRPGRLRWPIIAR